MHKKNFISNVSGNISILFSLALVPLMLAVGMAVDYSRANAMKAKMQSVLDASVLAAANVKLQTDNERIARGVQHFKAHFFETLPPVASISINKGMVDGAATYPMPMVFGGLFGQTEITIGAVAQARIGTSPSPCVLLLEPSKNALTINSGSQLNANCGIYVNSSNSEAIFVNSQSKIVATDTCVNGKYRVSASTISPTPQVNCPVKPDPLASLAEPSHGPCTFTDLVVQSGQSRTLSPGVYCKKLEIQNSASVTLQPGVYFFPDSQLIANAGGKIIGNGVMLYFNGAGGYLNANSDSVVQLTAITSGTFRGIVMFQSRASSSASAPPHIVNSNSSSFLQGMIYVPNGKLMMNSQSTLNLNATYTAVIARTMEINSGAAFMANANYSGATPVPHEINLTSSSGSAALTK
jgi:hypothetical protein